MSAYAQDPRNPVPRRGQVQCSDCLCWYWPDEVQETGLCGPCEAELNDKEAEAKQRDTGE
jgi:hypothetical protein